MDKEVKIWVIIPVWNCEKWLSHNLAMLRGQSYRNYSVHIVDDASTDRSPEIIKEYVDKLPNWTSHRNPINQKCPRNIWEAIERIQPEPEDVIFLLDGDDHLPSPRTLKRLSTVYQDPYIWLTYGQYQSHPKNTGQIPAVDYPGNVYHVRKFRESRLQLFNHPLTFRAHLWNALDRSDLQDECGNWFEIGYDKAIMLPLLEMATPDDGGSRHWKVLNWILYMYNVHNPDSDCHKSTKAHETVDRIWDRPPKKPHLYP